MKNKSERDTEGWAFDIALQNLIDRGEVRFDPKTKEYCLTSRDGSAYTASSKPKDYLCKRF